MLNGSRQARQRRGGAEAAAAAASLAAASQQPASGPQPAPGPSAAMALNRQPQITRSRDGGETVNQEQQQQQPELLPPQSAQQHQHRHQHHPQGWDVSLDGLSVATLGLVAAAVQAAGGPGSPLGQLLVVAELAFAGYSAARYARYNSAVLAAREAARRPEDVEALWRLFSHNRAGLLRHIRLEAFLQDWFWGDEEADATAAAATAATASVDGESLPATAAAAAAAASKHAPPLHHRLRLALPRLPPRRRHKHHHQRSQHSRPQQHAAGDLPSSGSGGGSGNSSDRTPGQPAPSARLLPSAAAAPAAAASAPGASAAAAAAVAGSCIRRGDAADFLAYAFWGSTREEVAALPGGAAALEAKLAALEAAAGCAFAPGGPTPGRRVMAHLREPLKVSYRPALVYALTELLSVAKRLNLAQRGYRKWTHPLFAAYVLQPRQPPGAHADATTTSAGDPATATRAVHSAAAAATVVPCARNSSSATSDRTTPINSARGSTSTRDSTRGSSGPMITTTTTSTAGGSELLQTLDRALRKQPLPPPPPHQNHHNQHQAQEQHPPPPTSQLLLQSLPSKLQPPARAPATAASATAAAQQHYPEQLPPIVFLHGIGIGLLPYQRLLDELAAAHPGRQLLALEYKHVSMRLTGHVPSVDELAVGVSQALAALGHSRATLVGHSYGTLVASRFSKLFPQQVHSLVLLDAVCFGMVMPQLLRGSIYYHLRPPSETASQNRRRQAAASAAAALAAQDAVKAAADAAAAAKSAAAAAAKAAAAAQAETAVAEEAVAMCRTHTQAARATRARSLAAAEAEQATEAAAVAADAADVAAVLERDVAGRLLHVPEGHTANSSSSSGGDGGKATQKLPSGSSSSSASSGKSKSKAGKGSSTAGGSAGAVLLVPQEAWSSGARLAAAAAAHVRGAAVAAEAAAREWAWVTFKGMFVRDLHTAVAMTVRFRWADMNMWPHELPAHSLVVLAGRDYLMGAEQLAAMLRGAGCGDCVMLHPGLDHGEILKEAGWRAAVVRRIAHVTAEADADLVAATRAAALLARAARLRGAGGSSSYGKPRKHPSNRHSAATALEAGAAGASAYSGDSHGVIPAEGAVGAAAAAAAAAAAGLLDDLAALPAAAAAVVAAGGRRRAVLARSLLRRLVWSLPPLPAAVEEGLVRLLPEPVRFDPAATAGAGAGAGAGAATAALVQLEGAAASGTDTATEPTGGALITSDAEAISHDAAATAMHAEQLPPHQQPHLKQDQEQQQARLQRPNRQEPLTRGRGDACGRRHRVLLPTPSLEDQGFVRPYIASTPPPAVAAAATASATSGSTASCATCSPSGREAAVVDGDVTPEAVQAAAVECSGGRSAVLRAAAADVGPAAAGSSADSDKEATGSHSTGGGSAGRSNGPWLLGRAPRPTAARMRLHLLRTPQQQQRRTSVKTRAYSDTSTKNGQNSYSNTSNCSSGSSSSGNGNDGSSSSSAQPKAKKAPRAKSGGMRLLVVPVPALLPESTVRTLLLLPQSTAALLPVLPDLAARAAPVLAEMWALVKPLMPKLLRAILPVMPRFLAALLPVLPAMARTRLDAATAPAPAAATAAAASPAAAAAAQVRAAVGTGAAARLAVGAAVAAGSADRVAAGAADVGARVAYGTAPPLHLQQVTGGGGRPVAPVVVPSQSVWERALGVAGVWAAALALLPECSMPYMPASANCCSAAGAESMWAAAASAAAATSNGDGDDFGACTARSLAEQPSVSAPRNTTASRSGGAVDAGDVSGGAAATMGPRHGSLGPEFPEPGALGDCVGTAAFAASADAVVTGSAAVGAGPQARMAAVAATVASRQDAAAEAAVAGAAATAASAAAGAAVSAAVAASGAAAAAELRYAVAAVAALHQTTMASAAHLWSEGLQRVTATAPAQALQPPLQRSQQLLQPRQAARLQRGPGGAGRRGAAGELQQAASEAAAAMQRGLRDSGLLSFRGWSGGLRRQVLLRGRGGAAGRAGRRGAGGSAGSQNNLRKIRCV